MNIEVNDKGILEFREVFGGISFITKDGEKLSVAMRDSRFEFTYEGVWYEAKNGTIRPMRNTSKKIDSQVSSNDPLNSGRESTQ